MRSPKYQLTVPYGQNGFKKTANSICIQQALIETGCENEQHHAVNDLLSLLYKGNDLDKEN